jgi:hypothetical protein
MRSARVMAGHSDVRGAWDDAVKSKRIQTRHHLEDS